MKKKLLAVALALSMAVSPLLPALAAGSQDEQLAAVTAAVKDTLGLDTDRYTEFYGEADDSPLAAVWNLSWSSADGERLNIEALSSGKILSYDAYSPEDAPSQPGTLPSLPAGSPEQAKQAAQAFLDRVVTGSESIHWDENTDAASLGSTVYRFSGTILVNGLEAGLTFRIAVDCADSTIRSFSRDSLENIMTGDIPSPEPSVSRDAAASSLRETLKLKLEYVLPCESTTAVLRYIPDSPEDWYVDAATGQTVNLSELFRQFASAGGDMGNSSGGTETPEAGLGDSLSQAEQEGISKLEGVLSRETLDAAARKITALGLSGYTLGTAAYSIDRDAEKEGVSPVPVTCMLQYGRQSGDRTVRRIVTVDARTGGLVSVSSSMPEREVSASGISMEQARKTAESFLAGVNPEAFAKTALYDSTEFDPEEPWSWCHSFAYAQKENGYFFPQSGFSVSIDAADGSVAEYSCTYDEKITFDSAEGIISMDAAVDAWLASHTVLLSYVRVPTAIDFSSPVYAPLEGMGMEFLYRLVLGYTLKQEEYASGIDAKTGEPAGPEFPEEESFNYTDIAGHWAQTQIERLASYGVGFPGTAFQPAKTVTQADFLSLLLSAEGWHVDEGDPDSVDSMYVRAYERGILTSEERSEGASVTRMEAVRLILNSTGYSSIAKLSGIWKTNFTDQAQIPETLLGYAALCEGLGIISGTPDGRFMPASVCTRAEAVVMLYNLLNR